MTAGGTRLAQDILPGEQGSAPRNLVFAEDIEQGTLFFTAETSIGRELWKSDTNGNALLVMNLYREFDPAGDPIFLEWTNVPDDSQARPVIRDADGVPIVGQLGANDEYLFLDQQGNPVSPTSDHPNSSFPSDLTVFDGQLYFSAQGVLRNTENDRYEVTGRELWATDGTPDGTQLVGDFTRQPLILELADVHGNEISTRRPRSSSPSGLVSTGNRLFFAANSFDASTASDRGRELWVRDASSAPGGGSNTLVKDIVGGGGSSSPTDLTVVGDQLFFVANTNTGRELWTSDGTSAGTHITRDLAIGSRSSSPTELTAFGDLLVFSADDDVVGREIWKTDGTSDGTTLIKDLRPGNRHSDSKPQNLMVFGDHVFFAANDIAHGVELWRTDGTTGGTELVEVETIVSEASDPTQLTAVGDSLFFLAYSPVVGQELWKTDGSIAGTRLVKDIDPGHGSILPNGSFANELINVNGTLFFTADDGQHGSRLWISDGTTEGTMMLADVGPAGSITPSAGAPRNLTRVGGHVFFSAHSPGTGRELWKSDGTVAGTQLVKDIDTTTFGSSQLPSSSDPSHLVPHEGTLYFSAYTPDSGRELWKSDGTAEGTVMVADIAGQPDGATGSFPTALTSTPGGLLFSADDGIHGEELWKTDGTAEGTTLVADLAVEPGAGATLTNIALMSSGEIFFRRDDFEHDGVGSELWKSDGTAEGTSLVVDLFPGSEGSNCHSEGAGSVTVEFNGSLVFVADDSVHGCELFISDGTSEGTGLFLDLVAGEESSFPEELTVIGDSLFFRAADESGLAVWQLKTDGSLSRAPLSNGQSRLPNDFTAVGETVFFAGDDGVTGLELWTTNLVPTISDQLLEVLAKDIAYQDWSPGQAIALNTLGYDFPLQFTVDHFFQDPITGFEAVGLVSSVLDPILAIRGSVDFLTDWFDDFHPDGIGTGQFLANFDAVASWLDSVTSADVRATITGHSLGGALSQLMAAQYTGQGGQLDQVVTFNAPAINADYAEMFDAQLAGRVVHYITNGDPVSMAGEKFIDGGWRRATFSDLNLANNHVLPVLAQQTFVGADRLTIRRRPADTVFEAFDDTRWLSHPLYFHTDADYFAALAGGYLLTTTVDALKPFSHIPPALLFRSTTEAQRQTVGQVWHTIQNQINTVIDSVTCNNPDVSFAVPDVSLNVLGLLKIEATGLSASCHPDPAPALWLQGEVKLPDFFNTTGNFLEDNRIELSPRGIEIVGSVTAESIPIVPGFLEVQQASIGIDTIANTLQAGAQLDVKPWDVLLGVDLGFVNNQWNSIGLGIDGVSIPIPVLPGGVLHKISGHVDHIAASDQNPIAFGGMVGMTLGPTFELDLPSWAGGAFEAKLLGFDGGAEFDSQHLEISADLSVLSDLATVRGTTTWNWHEGTLAANGGFDVLSGVIVSENASLRADMDLNINSAASATFSVPEAIPLIGGIDAISGDFFLAFTNDSNLSNDSTGAHARFDVPLIGEIGLGFRVWLDGSFGLLGADEIAQLIQQAGEGEEISGSSTSSASSVMVDEGKDWVLFSAEWQQASGAGLLLTTPTGQELSEADIEADPNMAIVADFTHARRRVVLVRQPTPGTWRISVDNATEVGEIQFYAAASNATPSAQITGLTSGLMREPVTISYAASDVDNQAAISFYYDNDAAGFDGVLIEGNLVETDDVGQLTWHTTGVPEGSYFIYAMIDDGVNPPVFAYSSSSTQVTAPGIHGFVWDDANADGTRDAGELPRADVTLFIDANGNGLLDAGEPSTISLTDGSYRFVDLQPDTYQVRLIPPHNYVQATPADGQSPQVTLEEDAVVGDVNFGIRVLPAHVSGLVWQDWNRDGFRDELEPIREGVVVRLLAEATGEELARTVTNAEGMYRFDSIIPGEYVIEIQRTPIDAIAPVDRPGSDAHDSNLDPATAQNSISLLVGDSLSSLDVGLFNAWHNAVNPMDVNADGLVSALDVLLIINYLNDGLSIRPTADEQTSPPHFRDVSENGFITALDALLIINFLNARQPGEAEASGVTRTATGVPSIPSWPRPAHAQHHLPVSPQLDLARSSPGAPEACATSAGDESRQPRSHALSPTESRRSAILDDEEILLDDQLVLDIAQSKQTLF